MHDSTGLIRVKEEWLTGFSGKGCSQGNPEDMAREIFRNLLSTSKYINSASIVDVSDLAFVKDKKYGLSLAF